MPDINKKVTRHTENQANMTHSEEKNQLDPEMTQVIDLVERDIKTFKIWYFVCSRSQMKGNLLSRDTEV